jgi:predicted nucleic acid-binding protein
LPRPPRIAWDSTCLIAWIDGKDTEAPEVLQAIDATIERMIRGHVRIVTSQAIEIEVRPGDLQDTKAFHDQLRACPHFESFPEGPAIRSLTRQLQDRLQATGRKGKYADLIHVATAIAARAQEFWTTDEKVLRWYAEGVITDVNICRPYTDQGVLDL